MIYYISNNMSNVSLLPVLQNTERGIIEHSVYSDNSTSQEKRSSGFHTTASEKPDGAILFRENSQPKVQRLALAPVKPDGV